MRPRLFQHGERSKSCRSARSNDTARDARPAARGGAGCERRRAVDRESGAGCRRAAMDIAQAAIPAIITLLWPPFACIGAVARPFWRVVER